MITEPPGGEGRLLGHRRGSGNFSKIKPALLAANGGAGTPAAPELDTATPVPPASRVLSVKGVRWRTESLDSAPGGKAAEAEAPAVAAGSAVPAQSCAVATPAAAGAPLPAADGALSAVAKPYTQHRGGLRLNLKLKLSNGSGSALATAAAAAAAASGSGGGGAPSVNVLNGNTAAASRMSYKYSDRGSLLLKRSGIRIGQRGLRAGPNSPQRGSAFLSGQWRMPDSPIADNLVRLEELGHGASGCVYKAIHATSLKLLAVKEVPLHDKGRRNQVGAEIKTLLANRAAAISPAAGGNSNGSVGVGGAASNACNGERGVVAFYDAFISPNSGCVSIVMEYCGGGSLQDLIAAVGPLDATTVAFVAADALAGLAYIHRQRKLHRDIKPGNMLLDDQGAVRLADFGLVRDLSSSSPQQGSGDDNNDDGAAADSEKGSECAEGNEQRQRPSDSVREERGRGPRSTAAHTFVGTAVYMSPERLRGEPYGFASDVWSLGLSLLTLAFGRFPLDVPKNNLYWHLVKLLCPPSLDAAEGARLAAAAAQAEAAEAQRRTAATGVPASPVPCPSPVQALPEKRVLPEPIDIFLPPEKAAAMALPEEFLDLLRQCLRRDPNERPSVEELLRHPFLTQPPPLPPPPLSRPAVSSDVSEDSDLSSLATNGPPTPPSVTPPAAAGGGAARTAATAAASEGAKALAAETPSPQAKEKPKKSQHSFLSPRSLLRSPHRRNSQPQPGTTTAGESSAAKSSSSPTGRQSVSPRGKMAFLRRAAGLGQDSERSDGERSSVSFTASPLPSPVPSPSTCAGGGGSPKAVVFDFADEAVADRACEEVPLHDASDANAKQRSSGSLASAAVCGSGARIPSPLASPDPPAAIAAAAAAAAPAAAPSGYAAAAAAGAAGGGLGKWRNNIIMPRSPALRDGSSTDSGTGSLTNGGGTPRCHEARRCSEEERLDELTDICEKICRFHVQRLLQTPKPPPPHARGHRGVPAAPSTVPSASSPSSSRGGGGELTLPAALTHECSFASSVDTSTSTSGSTSGSGRSRLEGTGGGGHAAAAGRPSFGSASAVAVASAAAALPASLASELTEDAFEMLAAQLGVPPVAAERVAEEAWRRHRQLAIAGAATAAAAASSSATTAVVGVVAEQTSAWGSQRPTREPRDSGEGSEDMFATVQQGA